MDDTDQSHSGRVLPELSNLELVARLQTTRCTGVLWLRTVERVVSYGTGTLRRQLLDESINRKLARLRCPVRLGAAEREYLRANSVERDDLVQDLVFAGLLRLRDHGILGSEWDPTKGADLMTYFVNGCLLALANPLRHWRKHRTVDPPTIACDFIDLETLAALRYPEGDPARDMHDRIALEELLAELPSQIVNVARSVASDGLSWADACRRHAVSPRVVEGHLRRYRRQCGRPEENR